jgi:hypothetical protein
MVSVGEHNEEKTCSAEPRRKEKLDAGDLALRTEYTSVEIRARGHSDQPGGQETEAAKKENWWNHERWMVP